MRLTISESLDVVIDGKKMDIGLEIQVDDAAKITPAALLQAVGARLVSLDGDAARDADATGGAVTSFASKARVASEDGGGQKPQEPWTAPEELHGKAWKSVHRVIDAIGRAGGRGLTVAEIQDKARISAVPVYKMLKDDTPQGRYAGRYLRTTRLGRSQVVDLTTEGRKLASLIRADKIPA